MKTEAPAYKRIVLKLSGEALQERGARENISPAVVRAIAERVKEVHGLGVQVSVVIGGGNIWRGSSAATRWLCAARSCKSVWRHVCKRPSK